MDLFSFLVPLVLLLFGSFVIVYYFVRGVLSVNIFPTGYDVLLFFVGTCGFSFAICLLLINMGVL